MSLPLKKIVSKNIKSIRKRGGISQETLAKNSTLSVRYISKVENDPPDITLCNLERIAKGLGVAVSELVQQQFQDIPTLSIKEIKSVEYSIRLLQSLIESLKKE